MNHFAAIGAQLKDRGLDAMLITSAPGEFYAAGFHGEGVAVITPDKCEDCNICSYVCPAGVISAREMPDFTYVQVRAMAAQKGGAAK